MSSARELEVWGGLECSFVRVAHATRDQVGETGHNNRPEDIDLIAGLGIRTLRYPVLWEVVRREQRQPDWHWHDLQLDTLRKSGIAPIAGLVHHGSGPSYCDVLDPDFPRSLANYAGSVARRYPWIDRFTPVNEPMTTARLCGLYGYWHPHGRDEATCFRVVVAECRAIALSMKEIRRVTPNASLVQTEDIGRVFSTELLRYQADYENERRWLALDLLMGRVDPHHPLYRHLLTRGIDERHLAELVDDPSPPDIMGIDQYLTSDRFLDERLDRFPDETPGSNEQHRYVDVAAVRVEMPREEIGFLPRIRETWARYGRPVALTEVHNGCTREEQLRWLMDGWDAANTARGEGIDLRAVSVWSLFGAKDWNSLLTRSEGFYEPGAFDIRFDPPRPTVIAQAARALANCGRFHHPVLTRGGWWKPEPNPAWRPPPAISEGMYGILADCCASRRLDLIETASQSASGAEPNRDAWAVIHVESGFRSGGTNDGAPRLRLSCRYRTVEASKKVPLVVEAAFSLEPYSVVHAFLDLVVDGAEGQFRVATARPSGQYILEPQGKAEQATDRSTSHFRFARLV